MSEGNIYTALHQVYRDVGYVQKTGNNQAQKYRYAGEGDLIKAIRPAMIKAGIVFYCSDIRDIDTREIRKSNNGRDSVTINVAATFNFRFVHAASGTSIDVAARGEGSDSLDKASPKAMTGALKYALRQTMVIETGDDPDHGAIEHDEPPVSRSSVRVEPEPAPPADMILAQAERAVAELPGYDLARVEKVRAWLKKSPGGDGLTHLQLLSQRDKGLRERLMTALGNRVRELEAPDPVAMYGTPEEAVRRANAEQDRRRSSAKRELTDYQRRLLDHAAEWADFLAQADNPAGIRSAEAWLDGPDPDGDGKSRWEDMSFDVDARTLLQRSIDEASARLGLERAAE